MYMLAFQNAKERTADDWRVLFKSRGSEVQSCRGATTAQVVLSSCGSYLGRLSRLVMVLSVLRRAPHQLCTWINELRAFRQTEGFV